MARDIKTPGAVESGQPEQPTAAPVQDELKDSGQGDTEQEQPTATPDQSLLVALNNIQEQLMRMESKLNAISVGAAPLEPKTAPKFRFDPKRGYVQE